jgi:hypothetical protein
MVGSHNLDNPFHIADTHILLLWTSGQVKSHHHEIDELPGYWLHPAKEVDEAASRDSRVDHGLISRWFIDEPEFFIYYIIYILYITPSKLISTSPQIYNS